MEKAAAAILSWLTGAWVVVLVPIFAFFFPKDGEHVVSTVERLIASADGAGCGERRSETSTSCSASMCRITFVVWTAVFLIGGVPYAVPLAALGGALEFIPVVGPAAAGLVVMVASLVAGYSHPFLLLGFLIAWRLIQDYVTSPLVMGRGVQLHPALVIFGSSRAARSRGWRGCSFPFPSWRRRE